VDPDEAIKGHPHDEKPVSRRNDRDEVLRLQMNQPLKKHPFMKTKLSILSALFLTCFTMLHAAEPIRVLVWDEPQPEEKQGYGEKFLGETLANHLAKLPRLSVKTANTSKRSQGGMTLSIDFRSA
jgi:hypothetical protein